MTSSQSPRAKRESTNDPEQFSKGEVQLGMKNPRKDGGSENRDAWEIKQDRDGSGWPPATRDKA